MPGQPIPQDRSGPILKLGPILTGYGAQRLCAGRLEAGDSKQIAEDITEIGRGLEFRRVLFRSQDRSGPILKLGPILTGYGAQRLCAGRLEAGDSKQIAEDIT